MDDALLDVTYAHFDHGRVPYATFLRGLDPHHREVVLVAVDGILTRQGTDVCASDWEFALGSNLYEFRIRRA